MTNSLSTPVRRPALVTVLVVLVVISGILAVLAGVIGFVASGGVVWFATGSIAVGLIYLAVARGLSTGDNRARMTVAAVSVLQILLGLLSLTATEGSAARSSAVGTAVFGAIVLLILFTPQANAFFGRRRSI